MTATARTYRGMTAEERDADRRRRLLAAALYRIAAVGYAGTTITDVCVEAKVTARSFYDHFSSREELLLALYHELIDEHAREVLKRLAEIPDDPDARIEAGVEAAVTHWLADERRARVCLLEIVGVSPAAERARFAVINRYVELIMLQVLEATPERDRGELRRLAVALVGAVIESVVDWLLTPPPRRPAPEELVATLQRLHLLALR